MPKYDYEANGRHQKQVYGSVQASTEAEARRILTDRGYDVQWVACSEDPSDDVEVRSPVLEDFSQDLPPNTRAIVISKGIAVFLAYVLLLMSVILVFTLFWYRQGLMLAGGPMKLADGTMLDAPSDSSSVHYEFKVDGQIYKGSDTLTPGQALEFEKGSSISVRCAAGKPKVNCINIPTNVAVRRKCMWLMAGAFLTGFVLLLACCCWEHVYTSVRCYRALRRIPPIQVARIVHNLVYQAAFFGVVIGGGMSIGALVTSIGIEYLGWHIALVVGAVVALIVLPNYTPFRRRT